MLHVSFNDIGLLVLEKKMFEGMRPRCHKQTFVSTTQGGSTQIFTFRAWTYGFRENQVLILICKIP